jgi:hypothetical protein
VACLASLASLDGRPDQVAAVCNMVARVDGVLSSQSSRMLLLYNWHGWDVVLGVWSCVCIKGAAGGAMGGLRAD